MEHRWRGYEFSFSILPGNANASGLVRKLLICIFASWEKVVALIYCFWSVFPSCLTLKVGEKLYLSGPLAAHLDFISVTLLVSCLGRLSSGTWQPANLFHFIDSRLEPLSGRIASVGELVPEEHRTTRGEVIVRDDSVMADETRVNKRVKTTIEDWENEQVR